MTSFSPSPCQRPRTGGFTLVEMIVVMGIMAVLLTIMVPVFSKLQDAGENATCQSNLQQLGAAIMAFQADKGFYPSAVDRSGRLGWVRSAHRDGGFWSNWARWENIEEGTLWPYTNTRRIYLCPTFDRTYRDANPNVAHVTAYCTYSLNEYVSPGRWQGVENVLRTQIRHPSRFAVIGEEYVLPNPNARYIINNLAFGIGNFSNPASDRGSIVDGMGEFHNAAPGTFEGGKTHIGFADGHVELRPSSDTKEVFTPWFVKNGYHPGLYPN